MEFLENYPISSNAKQVSNDNTWDTVNTLLGLYSPVLGTVGKLGQFAYGYSSAKQQRKDAISARDVQQNFQERMSSTAHQRQMADMRSAGLNPILSSKYGGSSSPSGSTFNPDNQALKTAQVMQATSNARTAMAQAELNEQNARYFRTKSYGSAVLNAKPTNLLFTEILERNPKLINKLSSILAKSINFADDPIGIITSALGLGEPSNAKQIPNKHPISRVKKTKKSSYAVDKINKFFDKSSFWKGKRYRLGDYF